MTKKVSIYIPWFTPAFKAGGPIQSVNQLIEKFNHNINYEIYSGNKDVDGSIIKQVIFDKWIKFNQKTNICYFSKWNFYNFFTPKKTIRATDLIYIIGIYSLKFNIIPLLFSNSSNKILSVRGMLHPGALSQKSLKKKAFLFFLKSIKIQNRTTFHATDENEKLFIQQIFGENTKIIIAENYPKFYYPTRKLSKEKNKLNLISVALISPMKNYLLILKSLKICKVDIEYHIIGAVKDKAYWNLCLKEIDEMPHHIKVVYHGEKKPNEIINHLENAHVFILPSKSENYGHAIIEALSAGKPVITSKNTPWNNLEKSGAGFNIDLVLNSISESITYFANLDQDAYDKYSSQATDYANASVDINKINQQYKNLFSIND